MVLMAKLSSEKDFLAQYSPENIIRQATQSPAMLALPPEYAQARPDTLAMDTDRILNNMARPTQNMQGQPGIPYTDINYGDKSNAALIPFRPGISTGPAGPIPKIKLDDITNMIRARESTGNYQALNREQKGNTASGAYQYTDATWNGYGGYSKAALAPKEVQDRRFQEDIHARALRFGGDPYKMIAAHYLPAAASNPATWTQPYKLKSGKTVKPVASYVAYVVKGTPLEQGFAAYLNAQGGQR